MHSDYVEDIDGHILIVHEVPCRIDVAGKVQFAEGARDKLQKIKSSMLTVQAETIIVDYKKFKD